MNYYDLPRTLGALKHSSFAGRLGQDFTVKDELRANLICHLETGQALLSDDAQRVAGPGPDMPLLLVICSRSRETT